MKKIAFTLGLALATSVGFAQQQIENSDFEEWEEVDPAKPVKGTEPVNWNSFMSASGSFKSYAEVQVEASDDVRPGSEGIKSAKLWSRDAAFGIKANGNLTLGIVNMGATIPSHAANYNKTDRSDVKFNQPFTEKPDSLVFWAKFMPNGHNENARMKATIHDDYDYRDPEDPASINHVVGTAVINYSSTEGEWNRFAVPFVYDGVAEEAAYILVTFTTNETPGGGSASDFLWIDDIELIYNELSVKENSILDKVSVYPNPVKSVLNLGNLKTTTNYTVVSVLGEEIQTGRVSKGNNKIDLSSMRRGVYFIRLQQGESTKVLKFIKD